jgi:DNA mismatch repair protein MLH1
LWNFRKKKLKIKNPQKEDLTVACERHYTSKISKFEDLKDIISFGFRGEALASVSHCSRLTITSKTKGKPNKPIYNNSIDSELAYKAQYMDGKVKGDIQSIAGLVGTQIRAEDLFYNNATRKKSLKPRDEHQKIHKMVSQYAIHNSGVQISLKKHGESFPQIHTQKKNSVLENIKSVFGHQVSKNLISLDFNSSKFEYSIKGYVSNTEYNDNKSQFILFVNNRLVENQKLKKDIELEYQPYIGKNNHPFVYLSLLMKPQNVEVNVHPTKQVIHWLHEDEIVDEIREQVNKKILESNGSRLFIPSSSNTQKNSQTSSTTPSLSSSINLVRTTHQQGEMETYLQSNKRSLPEESHTPLKKQKQIDEETLESIQILLEESKCESDHEGINKLMKDHHYVGFVNSNLSLIQHNDKLYVVNVYNVSKELMYQMCLKKFSKFRKIRLSEPLDIQTLLFSASQDKEFSEKGLSLFNQDRVKGIMNEYFGIEITNSSICTLPQLLENHVPNLFRIPQFLLDIVKIPELHWKDEKLCFQSIAIQLSNLYATNRDWEDDEEEVLEKSKYIAQHVIFPACKILFSYPPASFASDQTVIEIANISNLYKVFERC